MKLVSWLLLCNLTFFSQGVSQNQTKHFGEIRLQINDQPEQIYYAQSVNIFQKVSIKYDVAVQVKDKIGVKLFYYPQLDKGNHFVLHLIIGEQESSTSLSKSPRYNIFFDLDSTFKDNIQFNNIDSMVYFYDEGHFANRQNYSQKQQGFFQLKEDELTGAVAGQFHSEFEFPLFDDNVYHKIKIEGDVQIPQVMQFKGGDTAMKPAVKKKNNIGRNLVFAGLFTLGLLILVTR